MGWVDRIQARVAAREAGRARPAKTFTMPPFWSYDGARVSLMSGSYDNGREMIGDEFASYAEGLYKKNGIVYSCMAVRARVFGQARFQYQAMRGGRPQELFGGPGLGLLERPWARGTTGELLTHMEVDASLAGNFFATTVDSEGRIGKAANRRDPDVFLSRMRPDWCQLIVDAPSGNPFNVDARVVGLAFAPPGMRTDPLILTLAEFMHYSPLPDPTARFRGMSWLSPIVRDAAADSAYTDHKTAFLRNGAQPNLAIKFPEDSDPDEVQAFAEAFRRDYEGARNAYKTLFITGGADVTPLSLDFQQLEVKEGQGALETRIASAAGVHPAIAGLSEGLAGSSLNAGNFSAARRLMVDSTIRDLWSKAAASAESLFPPPDKTKQRLWYDARDIPFLREDAKDEASTFAAQIGAIRQGIEAGFDPDAMVKAAKNADVALLAGTHTGMVSVQLQPPGAAQPPAPGAPPGDAGMPALDISPNGNGRPTATVR